MSDGLDFKSVAVSLTWVDGGEIHLSPSVPIYCLLHLLADVIQTDNVPGQCTFPVPEIRLT